MERQAMLSARTLRLRLESLAVSHRRQLRRRLWDILAQRSGLEAQCECLLWEVRPGSDVSLGFLDYAENQRQGFDELPSFVFQLTKPTLIEPKYGYAIAPGAQLIDASLTYGWRTHSELGREWMGLPSLGSYASAAALRSRVKRLPEAVSLLSPWPENFYHFFVDVLPKLLRFEDAGVPSTLPILVHEVLAEMPFFKQAVQRGPLRERTIVPVGPNTGYLEVGTLYVANNAALSPAQAVRLLKLFGTEPRVNPPERRVFVTRAARRGRNIENFDELRPVLGEFGFEIVDTDDLTLTQQIELFQSTTHLAAVHGAGMINILFNVGQPLKIFEVIPFGQDASMNCFRILSKDLGYELERFHGIDAFFSDKRASFRVDRAGFRSRLERFVAG